MTQLEKKKYNAIDNLRSLCARCSSGDQHSCKVSEVISEIEKLNGVPVIVNEQLRHVVFS